MANNRLYIGNTQTKEYIFIEKGWGCGWDGDWFNAELFKEFIRCQFTEGNFGGTDLIFFTEHDEIHNDFYTNGIKFQI